VDDLSANLKVLETNYKKLEKNIEVADAENLMRRTSWRRK
jgi:hypothetical protein